MKKTHLLKTLYLQKPLLLILLVAMLSTLPWIGLGDFYTKGEPREAALATAMIEKGEWIIPSSYADEFAYKPPLNHWLIAISSISFTQGEVTPFTSRLPSALAFIALIGICFVSFARRRSILESFVACLILITCFELHRAAMTTRVDMLLTFFLVAGVIQLVAWHERQKIHQLVSAWLLLGMATLVKGPIGVLLPCLILGAYLLTQGVSFWHATRKCMLVALPALILPLVWYYAAYEIQGVDFLKKVFAENFGRFLGISTEALGTDYNLGVENPWYYYPITLLTGLVPWTILLLVSLFFIPYKKPSLALKAQWKRLLAMDKTLLLSLLVIIVSLVFFSIPTSKRSVYIMLIYPFLALFMARFFIYLVDAKPLAVRISTIILTCIASLLLLIMVLTYAGFIDIESLAQSFTNREQSLHDVRIFANLLYRFGWLGILSITLLLFAISNSIYLLLRKMNLKILMVGFALMFVINIVLDAFLLPAFKDAYSSRSFAQRIEKACQEEGNFAVTQDMNKNIKLHGLSYYSKQNNATIDAYGDSIMSQYVLKGNMYVMNNLLKYPNMYGLNFYLHNDFKNFEKELPATGYFLAGSKSIEAIQADYGDRYSFEELDRSDQYNDYKDEVILFRIVRKNIVLEANQLVEIPLKMGNHVWNLSCSLSFPSFAGIMIGKGRTTYQGAYIKIDATKLYIYNRLNGDKLIDTVNHGLDIDKKLTVSINQVYNKTQICLASQSKEFNYSTNLMLGNNSPFVESIGGTVTVDSLVFDTADDLSKKILFIADSYGGGQDIARTPGCLYLALNVKSFMTSNLSGGKAPDLYELLNTALSYAKPQFVIWGSGMNDASFSTWKSYTNQAIKRIQQAGAEPILVTIPSVPKVDRTEINTYVRTSGYRYIDFSLAVSDDKGHWHKGFLDASGIHPTEAGAMALAKRALIDFPELLTK